MIDQDIKKEAYEPYFREKLHIFSLELIGISVLMLICAIFMRMMLPYFAAFIFIIEVVHYRIIILSIIEQNANKYISDDLTMISISEVVIGEGKFGEDILYKFYPEKLAFGKYNIKCITDKEKKIRLRCAVSGNNWTIIHDNIEILVFSLVSILIFKSNKSCLIVHIASFSPLSSTTLIPFSERVKTR